MIETNSPVDVRTFPDDVFEELSKNPGVMDTDLIDSIVEPAPTQAADAARLLFIIEARYQAQRKSHGQKRVAMRLGVLAAALLIAFGGTFSAAKALRWDGILKVFASISELFLWATPKDDRDLLDIPKTDVLGSGAVADVDMTEGTFDFIEDVLSIVSDKASQKGILSLSKHHPFMGGSWYQDIAGTMVMLQFSIDQAPLFFEIDILSSVTQSNQAVDLAAEQEAISQSITLPDGMQLALVENYDIVSAQWVDGQTIFKLWGAVEKEKILQMIQMIREAST